MSSLVFESILLDVDFSAHSATMLEWESASLTTASRTFDALSIEFFLSYFAAYQALTYSNSFTDLGLEVYAGFTQGSASTGLVLNVLGVTYLTQ